MNFEAYLWPAVAVVGLVLLFILVLAGKLLNPLSKLFVFLGRANSGADGKPSSMRTNTFVVLSLFSVSLTYGFIWACTHEAYKELVVPLATILMGAILGCLGLKKWQASDELKAGNVTPLPPPTP